MPSKQDVARENESGRALAVTVGLSVHVFLSVRFLQAHSYRPNTLPPQPTYTGVMVLPPSSRTISLRSGLCRYRPGDSSAVALRDTPSSNRDPHSRDSPSRDAGSGRHRRDDRSRSPGQRPSDRNSDKRSRHRSHSRDGSGGEEWRRKRSRRDGDDGSSSSSRRRRSRSRERQRSRLGRDSSRRSAERTAERTKAQDVAAASAVAEARDDALRAKEALDLDAEMEKRRKRIEAWQASQRSKAAGGGAAPSSADADAGAAEPSGGDDGDLGEQPGAKKWSFEDEASDEEDAAPAPGGAEAGGAAASNGLAALKPLGPAADDEDVDPLDAFMAENSAAAAAPPKVGVSKPEQAIKEEEAGDGEVDPLDAFMADLPASTAPKPKAKQKLPAPKVILKLDTLKSDVSAPAAAAAAAPASAAPLTANGQVRPVCIDFACLAAEIPPPSIPSPIFGLPRELCTHCSIPRWTVQSSCHTGQGTQAYVSRSCGSHDECLPGFCATTGAVPQQCHSPAVPGVAESQDISVRLLVYSRAGQTHLLIIHPGSTACTSDICSPA